MANSTMCTYPQSKHALPYWKCILWCCADCPCINIPDQEITKKHDETKPTIRFNIYHIIEHCAIHGRISLKDKNICSMCKQESSPDKSKKYTPEKNLLWWRQQYLIFIQVSTYPPCINWPFIYHMCAYLVQITVVNAMHSLQTTWIISRCTMLPWLFRKGSSKFC